MAIERQITLYDGPGGPFEGMAVFDAADTAPRPGILLFPNILGTKEADFVHAEQLAALGHAVLVADVYGQGKRTTRADDDAGRYMNALNADPALLRERLHASLGALRALGAVDPTRVAAIGYCFGGKCVLDLARSGADIAGGVSFHGIYTPSPLPNAPITAKLLVCHGWDDPYCSPEATVGLAAELTAAGCDWQLLAHGHAGHAFTDTELVPGTPGLAYDEKADRRSWAAMENFLGELFA